MTRMHSRMLSDYIVCFPSYCAPMRLSLLVLSLLVWRPLHQPVGYDKRECVPGVALRYLLSFRNRFMKPWGHHGPAILSFARSQAVAIGGGSKTRWGIPYHSHMRRVVQNSSTSCTALEAHQRGYVATAALRCVSEGTVAGCPPNCQQHLRTNHQTDADEADLPSTTVPPFPVVRLHNLPRNWMHEEIIEFVHTVAVHAGIPEPEQSSVGWRHAAHRSDAANKVADASEQPQAAPNSAVPLASSPYVHRLVLPFGRRTGLVYGTPTLTLTSPALAAYLVNSLQFDPDDYRNRIYFTTVKESDVQATAGPHSGIVSFAEIEETVEDEKAEALRSLTLDRYLLAPDLLLDIERLHQRRLVTAGEEVLLDAFLDSEEDGVPPAAAVQLRTRDVGTRERRVRAMQHLGRGSAVNTHIPRPYVEGRRL